MKRSKKLWLSFRGTFLGKLVPTMSPPILPAEANTKTPSSFDRPCWVVAVTIVTIALRAKAACVSAASICCCNSSSASKCWKAFKELIYVSWKSWQTSPSKSYHIFQAKKGWKITENPWFLVVFYSNNAYQDSPGNFCLRKEVMRSPLKPMETQGS